LQLSKKGYSSLEISVETKHIHLLIPIQQKFGETIKPRSGANRVRYGLHNKESMLLILNRLNRHLRHPVRFSQLT
jgi:hypothetical protein